MGRQKKYIKVPMGTKWFLDNGKQYAVFYDKEGAYIVVDIPEPENAEAKTEKQETKSSKK
jgi:hypothetical protein